MLTEFRPLSKGILVAHGKITACASWYQILGTGRTSLGIWDIVGCVKIPDIDEILTPRRSTLCLEDFAKFTQPDLFTHGLGDLLSH